MRWLAMSVAMGNLLVPLNSTMIVVALPQVARDLGVDVAETSWIVTSYLIAMAALQPIAGRVGGPSRSPRRHARGAHLFRGRVGRRRRGRLDPSPRGDR